MAKRESIFEGGKRTLPIIFGIDLFLFCLLIFISPKTDHFTGLAYVVSFLTGFVGHVVWIPICTYFSILLVIRKPESKKNKNTKRHLLGILFISIGLGMLLTDIGLDGQESFKDSSSYNSLVQDGYGFNAVLGGGILIYYLCGLFTQTLGSGFTIAIAIIFILIGFFVSCWKGLGTAAKCINDFFKKVSERKNLSKPAEEEYDLTSMPSTVLKTEMIKKAPSLETRESETITDSRYQRRQEIIRTNVSPSNLPREIRPSAFASQSGLVPAVFGEDPNIEKEILPAVLENDVSSDDSQTEELTKSTTSVIQENSVIIHDNSNPAIDEKSVNLGDKKIDENLSNNMDNDLETIREENIPSSNNNLSNDLVSKNLNEDVNQTPLAIFENIEDEPAPSEVNDEPVSIQPKATPLPSYTLPGASLLNEVPVQENSVEVERACIENEQKINSKLESLGVGAYVSSHTIGPSVTRYEIKTNDNVPVSNVQRVINDLSIKLGGVPIRFETLIRGSDTSGLEVINPVTTTVYFRECFEALPNGERDNMVFPFGKDISGKVVFADLSDFPHMLVSGTTGSGKSVFLHQVILPLIMRNRPEDLKLLLIDPKHIEMGKYREIGHLICPVVNDPIKAKVALEKVVDEMERRYKVLDEAGGLSIREFNEEYAPEKGLAKLPFIVIVIDEFGDLVDSCKNISELILKIAAKARAAGIDIVLATQRPDVSVISGTIKANLQTRVALSMTSSTDSQTILGSGGAEDLNGKGDMLIDCGQVSRTGLTRCQGSFIDKSEIKRVADFIRGQYKVQYYPEFMDLTDHSVDTVPSLIPDSPSSSELKELNDENKYKLIKEYIMALDYASASGIQRKWGVGYPKAGKIMDRLTEEGIIAREGDPRNCSRGRFVIIHIETAPSEPVSSISQTTVIPDGFPQPGE